MGAQRSAALIHGDGFLQLHITAFELMDNVLQLFQGSFKAQLGDIGRN